MSFTIVSLHGAQPQDRTCALVGHKGIPSSADLARDLRRSTSPSSLLFEPSPPLLCSTSNSWIGMKRPRYLLRIGFSFPRLLLVSLLLSCSFTGILSSRIVTLGSIEIFNTHEWFGFKPTIYFYCKDGNKTSLPDVKKTNFLYNFKGEESWQPLTELPDKKCKRCGLYEEDPLIPDVFEEWELCPDDFVDGKYIHFKNKEFNATFICLGCTGSHGSGQTSSSVTESSHKKVNVVLVIFVCVLASILVVIGSVAVYKYWQKRKREQDQARFLKLFEEGDDIEDELGLGNVL